MRKDDRIRLRHMLDAANEALQFAQNRKRADLDSDRMLTLSLVKCVEIIGEAAGNVSTECRAQCPDIPWPDVTGMRHRLIHAYYDVNLDVVWQTVEKDLPSLATALERILQSVKGPGDSG